MRVLMFGWEFPPFNSGGLGTACFGLTKGLYNVGTRVTFVLPKSHPNMKADFVKLVSADCEVVEVNSLLKGYMTSEEYKQTVISQGKGSAKAPGESIFAEPRLVDPPIKPSSHLHTF